MKLISVSYTHLDVYKRQASHSAAPIQGEAQASGLLAGIPPVDQQLADPCVHDQVQIAAEIPVSYTHLLPSLDWKKCF